MDDLHSWNRDVDAFRIAVSNAYEAVVFGAVKPSH